MMGMPTPTLEDLDVMARTVYGEARGEEPLGRMAVAYVILNRQRKGVHAGATLAETCRMPWQFSCWNDPPQRAMVAATYADPLLRECLVAVLSAMRGDWDPTGGATFYFADTIPEPAWAAGGKLTRKIGHHSFYTGIR